MSAEASTSTPAGNGSADVERTENPLANLPPIQDLVSNSVRKTRTLFSEPSLYSPANASSQANKAKLSSKLQDEYRDVQTLPSALLAQQSAAGPARPAAPAAQNDNKMIEGPGASASGQDLALTTASNGNTNNPNVHAAHRQPSLLSQSLIKRKEARTVKPDFHPQWKLHRVLSGHLGWVRCVAVEPGNAWFATGAGDRVIKIWDLATGELKLSLTGHISTVRGLAVSNRHPYLFSCGEDKVRSISFSQQPGEHRTHRWFSHCITDGQMLGP